MRLASIATCSLLAALMVLGACGSTTESSDSSNDSSDCTNGDTRVCTGKGACVGGQQCESENWSACECDSGAGGSTASSGDGAGAMAGNSSESGLGGSATGDGGNSGGNSATGGGGNPATGGTTGTGGMTGTGGATGTGTYPVTCTDAAAALSNIGCEFWPTVTYTPIYTDFEFAAVVSNGGDMDATVTITGGALAQPIVQLVSAGASAVIHLPWVPALKGPEFSRVNTSGGRIDASVRANRGAYKLSSTRPITAWQFSPAQTVKSEVANCSGTSFGTMNCFSVANDASMLIPTTSMTGSYRVFSRSGNETGPWGDTPSGITITATKDSTTVQVQMGATCGNATWTPPMIGNCVVAGTGVAAAAAGETLTFSMNAGDVVQLLGNKGAGFDLAHADLSGSIVQANKAVQVVSFNPITTVPDPSVGNADHIESLLLPSEALGNQYLVAPPTSSEGLVQGGHVIRFYGQVDGTTLTYEGTAPTGAPATINAGEVVEVGPTSAHFKVTGNEPFAVGSFMLGAGLQGAGSCPDYPCSGDPAFAMATPRAQFRTHYVFAAPTAYSNFADVLAPTGAVLTLDGEAVSAASTVVAPGWNVFRIPLSNSTGGYHHLESTQPVGLQVMGFAHATSYYIPGGSNLKRISPSLPEIIE